MDKDEKLDIPMKPVLKIDDDDLWEDYYCPTCGAFLEYKTIGRRRIEKRSESTCRKCRQKIIWES